MTDQKKDSETVTPLFVMHDKQKFSLHVSAIQLQDGKNKVDAQVIAWREGPKGLTSRVYTGKNQG